MRFGGLNIVLLASLVAVLFASAPSRLAHAQGALSYVSPFASKGKAYSVHVYGSSLADGLFYGAKELLDDPQIKIVNKARGGTGLMRVGRFDWVREIDRQLAASSPDIAVLMFGIGDRGVFFPAKGKQVVADLAGKTANYVKRLDLIFAALKKKGIATYVVGNPVMRGPKTRGAMKTINDIARQRAFRYGFKYIDTWSTFAGDNGEYQSHGPDLGGRVRRLRSEDGVYFTGSGYRKLAHPLVQEIQRDIKIAKADRKVPLAGDEGEQKRVRPQAEPSKVAGSGEGKATVKTAGGRSPVKRTPKLSLRSLEQKPDHSEIVLRTTKVDGSVEAVKMQIYRPAIPAAVISHVIRRSRRSPDNKIGDQVRGEVTGNLTALSTIAPVNSIGAGGKLQTPITQSPYYKVLVKGETPVAKRGRADDFSWRPEAEKKPGS